VAFRVEEEELPLWEERLKAAGYPVFWAQWPGGKSLYTQDPCGQPGGAGPRKDMGPLGGSVGDTLAQALVPLGGGEGPGGGGPPPHPPGRPPWRRNAWPFWASWRPARGTFGPTAPWPWRPPEGPRPPSPSTTWAWPFPPRAGALGPGGGPSAHRGPPGPRAASPWPWPAP
jgi:hypothetical protein